jgi:hypothetical protein
VDITSLEKFILGGSPFAHCSIFVSTLSFCCLLKPMFKTSHNPNTMYPELIQAKLESVVLQYVNQHSEKPRLLKINQDDFRSILPHSDQCIQYGLRIKGVTTVGASDVKRGSYFLVP